MSYEGKELHARHRNNISCAAQEAHRSLSSRVPGETVEAPKITC
jgi:hypothetical protein